MSRPKSVAAASLPELAAPEETVSKSDTLAVLKRLRNVRERGREDGARRGLAAFLPSRLFDHANRNADSAASGNEADPASLAGASAPVAGDDPGESPSEAEMSHDEETGDAPPARALTDEAQAPGSGFPDLPLPEWSVLTTPAGTPYVQEGEASVAPSSPWDGPDEDRAPSEPERKSDSGPSGDSPADIDGACAGDADMPITPKDRADPVADEARHGTARHRSEAEIAADADAPDRDMSGADTDAARLSADATDHDSGDADTDAPEAPESPDFGAPARDASGDDAHATAPGDEDTGDEAVAADDADAHVAFPSDDDATAPDRFDAGHDPAEGSASGAFADKGADHGRDLTPDTPLPDDPRGHEETDHDASHDLLAAAGAPTDDAPPATDEDPDAIVAVTVEDATDVPPVESPEAPMGEAPHPDDEEPEAPDADADAILHEVALQVSDTADKQEPEPEPEPHGAADADADADEGEDEDVWDRLVAAAMTDAAETPEPTRDDPEPADCADPGPFAEAPSTAGMAATDETDESPSGAPSDPWSEAVMAFAVEPCTGASAEDSTAMDGSDDAGRNKGPWGESLAAFARHGGEFGPAPTEARDTADETIPPVEIAETTDSPTPALHEEPLDDADVDDTSDSAAPTESADPETPLSADCAHLAPPAEGESPALQDAVPGSVPGVETDPDDDGAATSDLDAPPSNAPALDTAGSDERLDDRLGHDAGAAQDPGAAPDEWLAPHEASEAADDDGSDATEPGILSPRETGPVLADDASDGDMPDADMPTEAGQDDRTDTEHLLADRPESAGGRGDETENRFPADGPGDHADDVPADHARAVPSDAEHADEGGDIGADDSGLALPVAPADMRPADALDTPDRKPRIALMGEFSAGKSTLSNLLIGSNPLPTKVTATQLPPVWISWGDGPAYREDLDGETHPVALDRLAEVDPAETRMIRIFQKSETLESCDIIDMPGISDPNMASEVWERMIGKADAVIWCTHATQAWRQSEAAVWETLDPKLRETSLLLVTRFDKLVSDKDRSRVLKRIRRETDGLFRASLPIALLDALSSREDPGKWSASGAETFTGELVALLNELSDRLGQPRSVRPGRPLSEFAPRHPGDHETDPAAGDETGEPRQPSRIAPRRIIPRRASSDAARLAPPPPGDV